MHKVRYELMDDVDNSARADGFIPYYDLASDTMKYADPAVLGGGASALDDLTDVDTTGATDGYVINLQSGLWVPRAFAHDADGADHNFPGGGGTTYLDDSGSFSTPSGTGTSWNDRVVTRQDTANAVDDEFNGTETTGTPSGWTLVDSGSHTPTFTKSKSLLSMLHPGGDASNALHALMKAPASIPTGTIIETAFRLYTQDNYCMAGPIFADGTTYNAGKQIYAFVFGSAATVSIRNYTGYNTQLTVNDLGYLSAGPGMGAWCFMRLKYVAANTWRAYISPDGVSWIETTAADISYTMTPTNVGFAVSSWGATTKKVISFEYFRMF